MIVSLYNRNLCVQSSSRTTNSLHDQISLCLYNETCLASHATFLLFTHPREWTTETDINAVFKVHRFINHFCTIFLGANHDFLPKWKDVPISVAKPGHTQMRCLWLKCSLNLLTLLQMVISTANVYMTNHQSLRVQAEQCNWYVFGVFLGGVPIVHCKLSTY